MSESRRAGEQVGVENQKSPAANGRRLSYWVDVGLTVRPSAITSCSDIPSIGIGRHALKGKEKDKKKEKTR